MIIETIFSTLDGDGKPNFAPMGVEWGDEILTVRPYRDTHTCRNLLSSGCGVANLTDDVTAFVRCGLYDVTLPHFRAQAIPGVIYQETCSWLEMEVVSHGGTDQRAEFRCRILHRGRQRDFLGFCRAGCAVIEAAILATRLDFHNRGEVTEKLSNYGEIVEKTGGEKEKKAFRMVWDYVHERGRR